MKINKEFELLLRPLTENEFEKLENSCLKEGIRDSIITWNGFIIDGHNRYDIAKKHKLKYRTIEKEFKNENDVSLWMILNQFSRRNLTKKEIKYLRGKKQEFEKGKKYNNYGSYEDHTTSNSISKEFNVDKRTIYRDQNLAKSIDTINNKVGQKYKNDILSEKIKITDQEINKISSMSPDDIKIIFEKAEEKEKNNEKYKSLTSLIKENKKEKNLINRVNKNIELPKNIDLYNDDCINALKKIDNSSIDCVITDPPYAIDYNHSWQNTTIMNDDYKTAINLLDNSCSLLKEKCKDDAHIYIFSSWKQIDVFKNIIESHFDISNILVWVKNNTSLVDFDKRYAFQYENIFFCKQKNNNERILNNSQSPDVLNFKRVNSPYHPTEKPVELLEYLIKNSTVKKELVVDCFMGSGSSAIACKNLNRNFIGIEIDKKYYDYAKSRME